MEGARLVEGDFFGGAGLCDKGAGQSALDTVAVLLAQRQLPVNASYTEQMNIGWGRGENGSAGHEASRILRQGRRGRTYWPAAAWSKATKLSVSSFWVFKLSDRDEDMF